MVYKLFCTYLSVKRFDIYISFPVDVNNIFFKSRILFSRTVTKAEKYRNVLQNNIQEAWASPEHLHIVQVVKKKLTDGENSENFNIETHRRIIRR
jgi:hypothetical protein